MQGPTGWWPDPSGAHPFRYFENGDPTTWVSDGLGPPRRVPPETLPPPPSAGPETTRTVGWYQNVADPARFKYWDGQQWIEATDHPSPDAAQPAEEPPPAKVRRRRRPHAVLTVAEALAIALALVAVIAFAFQASGPVHTAARTRPPGPAVPTTVPPPTTAPTHHEPAVGRGSSSPVVDDHRWADERRVDQRLAGAPGWRLGCLPAPRRLHPIRRRGGLSDVGRSSPGPGDRQGVAADPVHVAAGVRRLCRPAVLEGGDRRPTRPVHHPGSRPPGRSLSGRADPLTA